MVTCVDNHYFYALAVTGATDRTILGKVCLVKPLTSA